MIIKKFNFWVLSILLVQAIFLQGMEEGDVLVYGKKGPLYVKKGPYWSDLPYEIQRRICEEAGLFGKYKCVREISGSKRFGDRVALSPSGEKWACALPDGNIVIGDVQGDKIIGSYKKKCIGLTWDPSGDQIFVSFPDEILELEIVGAGAETGTDVPLHNGGVEYNCRILFNPPTITMYKGDGSIIASKALPLGKGNDRACIAWSPTSERVICSRGGSGTILMYDRALQLINTYPSGGEVTSLCYSHEEIIAGLQDGCIAEWNIKSGEVEIFSGHTDRVKSLVSPSKGRIVSLSQDDTVKHWSRDWMKPIRGFVFRGQHGETWQTVNLLKVWLLEHYLSKAKAKGRKYKLTWEKLAYFKILSDEMQAGYKDTIEMP